MTENDGVAHEGDKKLFFACFIALIATAFGFIIRALVIDDWAAEFNLTETQKGEIFGVGLWPFAISIVLFSLIIDRIGYGRAMVFAFACHVISAIVTIRAQGYWDLWIGNFIVALGNGTVEAVINPVVATMFVKNKTKWLNILHAGWPGGLVLGGLLTIALGQDASWQTKVALIFIPVIAYAILMFGRRFPVNERVAAGVSFKAMLSEVGLLGALVINYLMFAEVSKVFGWSPAVMWSLIGVFTIGFGAYVGSIGNLLFVFLLLLMLPLATTELGVDSWITALMGPAMEDIGYQAGWVLVYTSFVMMVLRFNAGPIVHRISPLGLLAVSSVIAGLGLVTLSTATGVMILVAATLYGIGKSFFWPTMLGVVAEQFPRGGALTLNATGGVGMLGVGVVGAVFLGAIQDKQVAADLAAYDAANNTALVESYVTLDKKSVLGEMTVLDPEVRAAAPEADQKTIEEVEAGAKKAALRATAVFPAIMLVCYLLLMVFFRTRGGYKPVELGSDAT
ncbi:MAG: MFS transporter [Planctomycetota bacterium]|nr:MFS transporter [Planctomycetota bacterium]MEC8510798.1 MFS transporter [Planctomycetota bacterium]